MRTSQVLWLIATAASLSACTSDAGTPPTVDDTDVEQVAPQSIAWVAPLAASTVAVDDVVDLEVYTPSDAIEVVHFTVDGAELDACDVTQYDSDCWDPGDANVMTSATSFAAPGTHSLGAWYTDPTGARVEIDRTITVVDGATADSLAPLDPGGDDSTVDPIADDQLSDDPSDTVVQAISATRGYLDPSSGWHSAFGHTGLEWRVEGQRVLFHTGSMQGPVHLVDECMRTYGPSIVRYADLNYVSRASVVAAAIAETGCSHPTLDEGPRVGLMQLTSARCVAAAAGHGGEHLTRAQCSDRMLASPDFDIDIAVRYLARHAQRDRDHNDPPRIAAVYHSGTVRRSSALPWRMYAPGGYITRFVEAYNAYRTWEHDDHATQVEIDETTRDNAPIAADPNVAAREACAYHPGARTDATLGDTTAARAALQHLVVLTQENHSLDALLGHAGHGIEGVPDGLAYLDHSGQPVHPHRIETCPTDIAHNHDAILHEWHDGHMDGFGQVADAARERIILGYTTPADHPFYDWLYTTFATSDRYFAAVLAQTAPNRQFLYSGTYTGENMGSYARSIFGAMDAVERASGQPLWRVYSAGYPSGQPGSVFGFTGGTNSHLVPYAQLWTDLAAGTMPRIVFVDTGNNEHPDDRHPSNVPAGQGRGGSRLGEQGVRDFFAHFVASPAWPQSAVVLTYDEGGGFFDHVPPPHACVATPLTDSFSHYDRYGVRVPVAVVSPFARRGFVSHRTHSHTSILRLIEVLTDLPALTPRDANADALLDLFDFAHPDAAVPAMPTAPAPEACCMVHPTNRNPDPCAAR